MVAICSSYLFQNSFQTNIRESLSVVKNLTIQYSDKISKDIQNYISYQGKEEIYSKFRQHYNKWEEDGPHLTDSPAQHGTNGYFIYECVDFCCGWADQMKGTMFAYMIANLTGRIFKARYLKTPCDMRDYIMPNKIDWFLDRNWTAPKSESSYADHIGDKDLKEQAYKVNFTERFNSMKKYHFFIANLQYFQGLRNTTVYKNELSWMKNITVADAYSAVYKRLFKLSPRLESKVQTILDAALPTKQNRLICIHVRIGKTAFVGEPRRFRIKKLPTTWKWFKENFKSKFDKIFVMSDSHKVIKSAYEQSFADRVITVPGALVHTNKFWRENITDPNVICGGFERLLVEYHILMNCDVLVRGYSGISVIAANARDTNEGLYYLRYNGKVLTCDRNKFDRVFI